MTEEALFHEALAMPPAERPAYLTERCPDPELRRHVEGLLAAHDRAAGPLDAPATGAYASEPAPANRPGAAIGPYKLLQRIGEGGMGEVWMAEQDQPVRRRVALKLIKAGMDSRQVIARFEAERQALALMDHQNIAKVLDAGTNETGRPFFVMELIRGVPITRFCDENHLTPRERLELFVPVCQAVQHAHTKGVIHRDLKPSNVLVTLYDGKPVPKVIDFGVAKALYQRLTDRTMFTEFGAVVGTLEYMAPEQAELSHLDVDTRSDVYSLGVLLYELLTGSTPFDRKRLRSAALDEVLRIIREEEPPKPSTRLSTSGDKLPSIAARRKTEPAKLSRLVRGELDWIVMKALEKDRGRRYETANGLAMDVQRHLADEPVLAGPPSASYRLRKFVRRNKVPVVAATLVVLSLVGGIIGTSVGLVWARQERDDKAKALIAETDARLAEKQARDKAMAALRDMTDELVENQMARGAQLTKEHKEFLQKIIKHYEGFAAITADDAESRAVRAEGNFRVGMMRDRLGELDDAEKAYNDALAIWKQLAADFPDRPEFRLRLAASHYSLGNLYAQSGRLKKAEGAFKDALALRKQLAAANPARPEIRGELAHSYNVLGTLYERAGRLKEAETAYSDAVALGKRLATDFPAEPRFREVLAGSQINLGNLFDNTGRHTEAEAAYADSLAVWKQLAADFPNQLEFRQSLARAYEGLGLHFRETGRRKEAEAAYTDALAVFRQLAADFPRRPDFRHDLATNYGFLGVLYADLGRPKDSERAYDDAIAIEKRLSAEFPERPDYRLSLAIIQSNLGDVFRTGGRLKEADAAFGEALFLQKHLVTDDPNRPDGRNGLAVTYGNLADLRVEQRDFAAAKAYLDEAMPHHDAALKANPQNPTYRECFRNNLVTLVRADAGLRDEVGAVKTAERLRDLGSNPADGAYDSACALARCIVVVENDNTLDAKQRRTAIQSYADRAMAMLRQALAAGYRDIPHLLDDSDLISLRGRPEYAALLWDLADGKPQTTPPPTAGKGAAP